MEKLCDVRRDSTALTAAITYGPGLKALGWVTPHAKYPRLLFATADANPALIAFEAVIADRLNHPAFSQFGAVEVKTSEARAWSESWALESPTDAEKRVMANMLLGTRAPQHRGSKNWFGLEKTSSKKNEPVGGFRTTEALDRWIAPSTCRPAMIPIPADPVMTSPPEPTISRLDQSELRGGAAPGMSSQTSDNRAR